jgi:hypothetical protein
VFIETVFGSHERQEFEEPSDGYVKERLAKVADLRRRPETWDIKVDRRGLDAAKATRRAHSPADKILTAGPGRARLKPRLLIQASQGDDIAERLTDASGGQATLEATAAQHWHERTSEMLANSVSDTELEYYATDPPIDVPFTPIMLFTGATRGQLRALIRLQGRIERLREIAGRMA